MTNSRIALGKTGEDEAVLFLNKHGFKIIERNYKCCYGEIDIVAAEKGAIAFVEVKTRRTGTYGLPQMSVNFRKQQQISKAACHYIAQKKIKDMPLMFDVVAVNFTDNKIKIELIKNAFEACL